MVLRHKIDFIRFLIGWIAGPIHLTTIIHIIHNTIHRILTNHNTWLSDREEIGKAFEQKISNLFTSISLSLPVSLQGLIPKQINVEANCELEQIPDLEEIREPAFTMGTYKSPGPDGMTTMFYKMY